jgi:hypothetical protein
MQVVLCQCCAGPCPLCVTFHMHSVSKVDFVLGIVTALHYSGAVFCCEITSVQSSYFLLRQFTDNKTTNEEFSFYEKDVDSFHTLNRKRSKCQ